MYVPEKFKEQRTHVMHALMREHPFATLVVVAEDGPLADHVPLLLDAEPAPLGALRGHIARANPLWKRYPDGGDALAVFQGPQRYISPRFYVSKRDTGEVVPTWNYVIVHARGTLRFTHDPGWLRRCVGDLTDAHESTSSDPWKVEDAPAAYTDRMLESIVGFEFSIAELIGKWKLSQNRTPRDRHSVRVALADSGSEDANEMLKLIDGGS